MQSAELYSHPLRVLDVEARLGAPPVLQTSALQLLLEPILLRVPVRNGVGDVVHVEGLERLARGPGCRRHPGRRGCCEAQALNELPPVHFSLFEILEQFCDDTFHCLSSYSEVRRDSIGLPAPYHYTIRDGSVG